MSTEGLKFDSEKDRWELLPVNGVRQIVKVLTFGAKKYGAENWRLVDNHRRRYYAAAMRHLTAWYEGEENDPETGFSHLAHAGCCILFLLSWKPPREIPKAEPRAFISEDMPE